MASLLRVVIARLLSNRSGIAYKSIAFVTNGPAQPNVEDDSVRADDELDEVRKSRAKDMPETNLDNPYKEAKCRCILCEYNVRLDYKNAKLLSQFISPHTGQLYSKPITGLCQNQYDKIKTIIWISKTSGFMPFVYKDLIYLKDPKICVTTKRR